MSEPSKERKETKKPKSEKDIDKKNGKKNDDGFGIGTTIELDF